MKAKLKKNIFIILFSVIYIIVGVSTYKDYGIGIEEHFQISSGLFWAEKFFNFFGFEKYQILAEKKYYELINFNQLPSMNIAYYFGFLFDLPMAIIECVFSINDSKDYFFLRHLSNFFIFYISGVYFYKILKKRTQNQLISFLGTTLYLLAPKAYGNSFFDGKDLFFLSILTISFFYYFSYEIRKDYYSLMIFSLFASLATSSRIFGLMIPITFIFLLILELINNNNKKDFFNKISFFLFFYFIFLFSHWPYMWTFNLSNLNEFFEPFKVHGVNKVFFDGKFFESNYLPLNYIPKWILISTPVYYLFLFVFGYLYYIRRIYLRFEKIKNFSMNNDLWKGKREKIDFINFFSFFQVIFIILSFEMNLIKGWTHFLFLNYFLIYFASLGIYLFYINFKKKIKISILLLNLFILFSFELVYKLIIYHPYQSIYFNNLVKKKEIKYEVDYQSLSRFDAIKFILDNTKKDKIIVSTASWTPLENGASLIPLEDRKKIIFSGTTNKEESDFIYTNYFYEVDIRYNKKYEIPDNFSLFKTLYIDDIKVYSIYKKKS